MQRPLPNIHRYRSHILERFPRIHRLAASRIAEYHEWLAGQNRGASGTKKEKGRFNKPPKWEPRPSLFSPFSVSPAASPKRACLGCPLLVPLDLELAFLAVQSPPGLGTPRGRGTRVTSITFCVGGAFIRGESRPLSPVAVFVRETWSCLLTPHPPFTFYWKISFYFSLN
jgi:hypothetical protein